MKRVNIKCPYCGSQAFLRPTSVVFGEKAADPAAPYYVCAHFPACDSYVSTHRASHMPMGTLADGQEDGRPLPRAVRPRRHRPAHRGLDCRRAHQVRRGRYYRCVHG